MKIGPPPVRLVLLAMLLQFRLDEKTKRDKPAKPGR